MIGISHICFLHLIPSPGPSILLWPGDMTTFYTAHPALLTRGPQIPATSSRGSPTPVFMSQMPFVNLALEEVRTKASGSRGKQLRAPLLALQPSGKSLLNLP